MGKITVNETANEKEEIKEPKQQPEVEATTVAVVDMDEAEKIADSADVFTEEVKEEALVEVENEAPADSKSSKKDKTSEKPKTTEKVQSTKANAVKPVIEKVSVTPTKRAKGEKKASIRMVMDVRPGSQPRKIDPTNEEKTTVVEKASEEPKKAPLSKPKAAMLAVATALVVGVIGGFVIWLTGNHTPEYCTVEFEPNGGTAVEEQTVACGAIIERPDDPTKDGFEFLGWMYNGEVFDFYSMRSVAGMILKARWEALPNVEIVTVRFNSDGGSEVEDISVKKGEKIKTSPITKKNGYRFLGWYHDTGDKLVKFDFNTAIESDMLLEAMWELIPQEEPEKQPAEQQPTTNPTEKKVESIEVANQILNVGEVKDDIKVTIAPADAQAEIVISLSDSAREVADCAASLSEQGMLTCWAHAPGEARVVVRDTKSGVLGAFKITVLPIPVESVSITGAPGAELEIGATVTLGATVLPRTATYRDVTWSSDNSGVADVSSGGVVTAKAAGVAWITATADGKSDRVKVTVKTSEPETKPVESVRIEGVPEDVKVGDHLELRVVIEPGDADYTEVSWSSSNSDIAEVDAGHVTAKAEGTVTIMASVGGVSASVEITIAANDDVVESGEDIES